MSPITKYWAFISYSSKDRKWGQWLHRRLENYPIPADLQGQALFDGAVLGKNLRPVFRDRDELSGSADLGAAIHQALASSRFLVVLCSRNSAKSAWVDKEIADFKAMGKGANILALILDGEPNATSQGRPGDECFPPQLRLPEEPIAGDLRRDGDGPERGFLKVLAGIAQLDFDKLYRRHERAQARLRRLRAGLALAAVSLFAGLAGLAFWQANEASRQRGQAVSALTEIYNKNGQEAASAADFGLAVLWYRKSLELADNPVARIGAMQALDNLPFEVARGEFSEELESVAVSQDGKVFVAICGEDRKTMRVIDLASGAELKSFVLDRAGRTLALSPDGKTAAVGMEYRQLALWDLTTGILLTETRPDVFNLVESATGEVLRPGTRQSDENATCYSPDGTLLASGMNYNDPVVVMRDGKTGEPLYYLEGHDDVITSLAFTPNGATIVSGSLDGAVIVWDLKTRSPKFRWEPGGNINAVSVSLNGERVAAGTSHGAIAAWYLADGKPCLEFEVSREEVSALRFREDGSLLAGFDSGRVRVLDQHGNVSADFPTGDGLLELVSPIPGGTALLSASYAGYSIFDFQALRSSGAGRRLAGIGFAATERYSATSDKVVLADNGTMVPNDTAGNQGLVVSGHGQGGTNGFFFSPDGSSLVTMSLGSSMGVVKLWDVATGAVSVERPGYERWFPTVGFSGGAVLLADTDEQGRLRFLDLRSGKAADPLGGTAVMADGVAFSPAGDTIAVSRVNGSVELWDLKARRLAHSFAAAAGRGTRLVFSPDGSRLAALGLQEGLQAWECASGRPLRVPVGSHGDALTFSPDNRFLALSGYGVTVVDLRIGETLCRFGNDATDIDVQFLADGETLVTHDRAGLYFWDSRTGKKLMGPWTSEGGAYFDYLLRSSPNGKFLAMGDGGGGFRIVPLGLAASFGDLCAALRQASDYGIPYGVDLNGEPVPQDRLEYFAARAAAAKAGTIAILAAGGTDFAERWQGEAERLEKNREAKASIPFPTSNPPVEAHDGVIIVE